MPSQGPSQQTAGGEGAVKSVTFQDIKLVYESHGAGDCALVFVHGWTCSRALWLHQAPIYSKYRSILVDLPGHGQSDKPEMDYNLEFFARSLNAVLAAENISRIVLVAHSMGGPVSNMFLRLFPKLVSGIIYLDSFWQMPESYLTIEQRRQLATHRSDDANFRTKIEELFTERTPSAARDLVLRTMMATPKQVRVSACCTESQPHALPWDTTFQIPALHLAVQGANTDRYWHHHMPKLQVREWAGLSHFLFLDEPQAMNTGMETFIIENNLLPSNISHTSAGLI